MKSTRLIAKAGLLAALFALAGAASAQVTASKGISVTATLTSKCQVATGSAGAITMAFGTYVAFVGPATAPQQTVNFECTRGLSAAPSFAWDATNGSTTPDNAPEDAAWVPLVSFATVLDDGGVKVTTVEVTQKPNHQPSNSGCT